MVEFQLEDVFLVVFILNVDRKPNVGMSSSSWDRQWQDWHTQGWPRTKNGGISDDNDNARVTHRLVEGDLYGDVRAKRSQLQPAKFT